MVTFEARFIRAADGHIYAQGPVTYAFLRRYLDVFEHVTIFARVHDAPNYPPDPTRRADGERVDFFALPVFRGAREVLTRQVEIARHARRALAQADAFLIRVFGSVGTLLWRQLRAARLPYGVEVVSDPWDALSPGAANTLFRPLLRWMLWHYVRRQCRHAAVAAYVTEHRLQERYPPGGWTTHYSSLDLPESAFADESAVQRRADALRSRPAGPFHLCFVGDFDLPYKAPDVMLDTLALCVREGLNVDLTMVGGGVCRGALEEQARRLNVADRVRFTGRLPVGAAVYAELDRADLYVLPSRQEGLPRTIIEAMARAAPCLGTNVGGFPELLEPENMVSPNDPAALAARIRTVLRDPGLLTAMSRRNLHIAQRYRPEVLRERRRACYQKLAEVSAASRGPSACQAASRDWRQAPRSDYSQ